MNEVSVPANAMIDRREIERSAEAWIISSDQFRTIRTSSTGKRQERLAWQSDPAMPMIKAKRRFDLQWSHVGDSRAQVEEIAAVSGEHTLILWRHEQLAWRANGSRSVFRLPNNWTLATDQEVPPGGLSPDRFAPVVKVDALGTELAVESVDDVTFDGATAPPPATVWFRTGGSQLRLESAPTQGLIVYARVVPEYVVFCAPPPAKTLDRPNREPATLIFLEV